jgi:Phage integrase, N-terminal SAM-like domain
MARKATGAVIPPKGKQRSWAIRFRAYGKRRYVTLGTLEDGWDRGRAEAELANVLADVRRGIWRPPAPDLERVLRPDPTFHEFASEWFDGLRHEGQRETTLADYHWQLTCHPLPFFAGHRLSQITVGEVDRYRQAKVREGRLSATSINKTITRLAQVLDVAVERDLLERNVARGRRRKLRQRAPLRSWLDRADQIAALLDAAGELDHEARSDRRATLRRTLLATLAFAGCGSARPSPFAGATWTWRQGACGSVTQRRTQGCATWSCSLPCGTSLRRTRPAPPSPATRTSCSRTPPDGRRGRATYGAGSWLAPSSARTSDAPTRGWRRCRRG